MMLCVLKNISVNLTYLRAKYKLQPVKMRALISKSVIEAVNKEPISGPEPVRREDDYGIVAFTIEIPHHTSLRYA